MNNKMISTNTISPNDENKKPFILFVEAAKDVDIDELVDHVLIKTNTINPGDNYFIFIKQENDYFMISFDAEYTIIKTKLNDLFSGESLDKIQFPEKVYHYNRLIEDENIIVCRNQEESNLVNNIIDNVTKSINEKNSTYKKSLFMTDSTNDEPIIESNSNSKIIIQQIINVGPEQSLSEKENELVINFLKNELSKQIICFEKGKEYTHEGYTLKFTQDVIGRLVKDKKLNLDMNNRDISNIRYEFIREQNDTQKKGGQGYLIFIDAVMRIDKQNLSFKDYRKDKKHTRVFKVTLPILKNIIDKHELLYSTYKEYFLAHLSGKLHIKRPTFYDGKFFTAMKLKKRMTLRDYNLMLARSGRKEDVQCYHISFQNWMQLHFILAQSIYDQVTSKNIIHADLKEENIIINPLYYNDRIFKLSIIDFGTSGFIESKGNDSIKKIQNPNAPTFDVTFTEKYDVYSLGKILDNFTKTILSYYKRLGRKLDVFEIKLLDRASELIKKMIEKDSNKRLSLKEVIDELNHIYKDSLLLDKKSKEEKEKDFFINSCILQNIEGINSYLKNHEGQLNVYDLFEALKSACLSKSWQSFDLLLDKLIKMNDKKTFDLPIQSIVEMIFDSQPQGLNERILKLFGINKNAPEMLKFYLFDIIKNYSKQQTDIIINEIFSNCQNMTHLIATNKLNDFQKNGENHDNRMQFIINLSKINENYSNHNFVNLLQNDEMLHTYLDGYQSFLIENFLQNIEGLKQELEQTKDINLIKMHDEIINHIQKNLSIYTITELVQKIQSFLDYIKNKHQDSLDARYYEDKYVTQFGSLISKLNQNFTILEDLSGKLFLPKTIKFNACFQIYNEIDWLNEIFSKIDNYIQTSKEKDPKIQKMLKKINSKLKEKMKLLDTKNFKQKEEAMDSCMLLWGCAKYLLGEIPKSKLEKMITSITYKSNSETMQIYKRTLNFDLVPKKIINLDSSFKLN